MSVARLGKETTVSLSGLEQLLKGDGEVGPVERKLLLELVKFVRRIDLKRLRQVERNIQAAPHLTQAAKDTLLLHLSRYVGEPDERTKILTLIDDALRLRAPDPTPDASTESVKLSGRTIERPARFATGP